MSWEYSSLTGAADNDLEIYGVRIESVVRIDNEVLLSLKADRGQRIVEDQVVEFDVVEPVMTVIRSSGSMPKSGWTLDRFACLLETLQAERTEFQLSSAPGRVLTLSYQTSAGIRQIGLPGTRIAFEEETPRC